MGWLSNLLNGGDAAAIFASVDGRSVDAATSDPFSLPMVQACRQLIADTVGSFPLVAVGRDGEDLDQQPLFLAQPDPLMSSGDLLERVANDMTRHGNAWLRVTARDSRGHPLAVAIADAQAVIPILSPDQQYVTGAELYGTWFSPQDLVQIPLVLDGSPVGVAPITKIRAATTALAAAYAYSSDYYGQGALPPYAITSGTRIPKLQAEELMTSWLEARDKSRPALLTGDLSLQPFTGTSAKDSLIIEALNHLDAVIARTFMVPPSLVNALSQSALTYTTTRDESRKWLVSLNSGYLKRIESAFASMLPRGQSVRFDTSSLLELDATEKLSNAIDGYTAGLISLPEARRQLGLASSTADLVAPATERLNP